MTSEEKQVRNHINKVRQTIPSDLLQFFERVIADYTMLPIERLVDLYFTIIQLRRRQVAGDFVEFGVWKGGALGCMALAANQKLVNYFNVLNMNTKEKQAADLTNVLDWSVSISEKRRLFGFDTFEGHPEPHDWELDIHGTNQNKVFHEVMERDGEWASVTIEDVQNNLSVLLRDYPKDIVKLVKGDASVTGPDFAKSSDNKGIALLRLDMDWYEPTIICLDALGHHIPIGGVVILDDFGHHLGVQEAAEEYFSKTEREIDVTKIDYSCVRIVFLS
ncbi:MAG: TylF/MycF/NovP-related O-methyltransferase [Rhodospirillaceae bacterium]|nr:TylF/MycF/NovP-related O-methyltransferase [Rhodospirillaceae bacterium]